VVTTLAVILGFQQAIIADRPQLKIDDVLSKESIRPQGKWYEARVPDTLDLAERARLALRSLTNNLDPEDYYAVTTVSFDKSPRVHSPNWDITPKNARTLPTLRVMCGSDYGIDVEYDLMRTLLSAISEDGQMYYPVTASKLKGTSYPQSNAIAIFAMLHFHARDGNPEWLRWIDLLAKGIRDVAIEIEDRAFFPMQAGIDRHGQWKVLVPTGQKLLYDPTVEPTIDAMGYEGAARAEANRVVSVLARHYALTGDKESLEMARKILRFILKPSIWSENADEKRYPGYEHGIWRGHFHNGTQGLNALLDMAVVDDNDWLKEFCREYYEHTRRNGIVRMGWFPAWSLPEISGNRPADLGDVTEPCALGDFVLDAIRLSDAGLGDYWDDVEYTVRNHLVEQQVCDLDKLCKVAGVDEASEGRALLGRYVGTFTNGSVTHLTTMSAGQCCAANGAQGLYYAWHGITRFEEGVATVNLFLNRASPWMDIDSYLPFEGKVVLHNKQARTAIVRIPGWVNKDKVRCTIVRNDHAGEAGKEIRPPRFGNRLVLEGLSPGDAIAIEFPQRIWIDEYTIHGEKYEVVFKGSTILDVNPRPKGNVYGYYNRIHYRSNVAPMKIVKRFASQSLIPLGTY
jgi:hypothetical protein